ncbi:hypothetical protein [Lederbergia citrea]|uniref:hypothetical protein n=1 Tax=Lederbergia citrea TaxID=2833581 RepID=UPI0020163CDD|nr:hypothetical protein [Lederbergia citrea]
MKKKLLFVIDSLDSGGAEKSLVTLLSFLDYSRYSVDLMMFGHGGVFEEFVPKEVNILRPLKYTMFTTLNVNKAFVYSIKGFNLRMLFARLNYSIRIRRKGYGNSQIARIFWESVSNVIESNPKVYDIAISYAQGVPTFFVAEKVKSKIKIAWVNTSYKLNEQEKKFQKKYYDQYNKIITVSQSAQEIFLETFPIYTMKTDIIYDINNPDFISKMANVGQSYDDSFNGIRLLTIGRFDEGKGYDIALEACKILKEKGINFRWYALGKGPLKIY